MTNTITAYSNTITAYEYCLNLDVETLSQELRQELASRTEDNTASNNDLQDTKTMHYLHWFWMVVLFPCLLSLFYVCHNLFYLEWWQQNQNINIFLFLLMFLIARGGISARRYSINGPRFIFYDFANPFRAFNWIKDLMDAHTIYSVTVITAAVVEYFKDDILNDSLIDCRFTIYSLIFFLCTIKCISSKLICRMVVRKAKKNFNCIFFTYFNLKHPDECCLVYPYYIFRGHPERHTLRNYRRYQNKLVGKKYVDQKSGKIDWPQREIDYIRLSSMVDLNNVSGMQFLSVLMAQYNANVELIKQLLKKKVYYLLLDIEFMRQYSYQFLLFPGTQCISGWMRVHQYWWSKSKYTHSFIGRKQMWDIVSKLKSTGSFIYSSLPSQADFLATVMDTSLWNTQLANIEHRYQLIESDSRQINNIEVGKGTENNYAHEELKIGKIEGNMHGCEVWEEIARVVATFYCNNKYSEIVVACEAQI